jgi:hypothetical protein
MPKNLSTKYEDFVNENLPMKKKPTKQEIKNQVFECLTKSDKKLSLHEISTQTCQKTDNVYVAIIGIKEVKSKKIGDINYWYINENQKDPIVVKKVSAQKTDPMLERWLKEDDPNNRKIFRNHEDYMQYVNPERPLKKVRKSKKK